MSYQRLQEHHRRLSHFRHLGAIAGWDEATMMSAQGGPARGEALATLYGYMHQQSTLPEVGEWLDKAATEEPNLDPWQRANLREMQREWRRATALPQHLVEAMTLAEARCEQAWRSLRPANDFAGFLPLFREVVARKREAAQAMGERLGLAPYDALLDGFEPGLRASAVAPLFARLRAFLAPLVARVVERQRARTVLAPRGPFPEERQRWLGLELMRRLGFDFGRGRLDTSHHPFCGGVPSDVRITTRYSADDCTDAMMGVIHETGHAKYEQNLPVAWLGQPVGNPRGMSVHEGQSLFFEMQVARSRAFMDVLAPLLAQAFPDADRRALAPDNLFQHLTRVEPSLIRVGADEVTYPCHIILRFELEKALIEKSLEPEQVPQAWSAGMQALLGLSTSGNDRDGCMQDVHWPAGLFGYFPAYTLGAMTAAQLFQAAQRAIPHLDDQIRRCDLDALDAWLRAKVWSQASFLTTDALVTAATGRPLDASAFEQHLERRYLRGEG